MTKKTVLERVTTPFNVFHITLAKGRPNFKAIGAYLGNLRRETQPKVDFLLCFHIRRYSAISKPLPPASKMDTKTVMERVKAHFNVFLIFLAKGRPNFKAI